MGNCTLERDAALEGGVVLAGDVAVREAVPGLGEDISE